MTKKTFNIILIVCLVIAIVNSICSRVVHTDIIIFKWSIYDFNAIVIPFIAKISDMLYDKKFNQLNKR